MCVDKKEEIKYGGGLKLAFDTMTRLNITINITSR